MPELLADPGWTHVVPDLYLNYLKTDAQSQRIEFIAKFGSELDENLSIDDLPSLMAAFNLRYEQLVGRMNKDGAELLFGTDTAVGGFGWASPPGLGGYWEVQAWSRAGISPRTLFESLTIGNARAFGLDREIGSVEVGKRADLLLLRENPLAMVDAYNTIEMVILGGNRIARKTLSATAEKAGNRNLVDVQRTH
jgi:imidazolonepropionase-like amidohydrolase